MKPSAKFLCSGITAALVVLLCIGRVHALDVELNPGYIQGNVTIAGEVVDSVRVSASGCSGHYASQTSDTASYSLTVHVEGSECEYTLSCRAETENGDYINFPSRQVTVTDNGTITEDFSLAPGYVTGTVSITGGTVQSGYVHFSYYQNGQSISGGTNFSGDGNYLIPVAPGIEITLYGRVYDTNSTDYSLDGVTLTVGEAVTLTHDWTVPFQPLGTASITGNIALGSITTFDYISIGATGPDGYEYGSWQSNGDYAITDLRPGDWTLSHLSLQMSDWDDYLRMPLPIFERTFTLAGAETALANITAIPCFVNGRVSLKGSKRLNLVSSGSVSGDGLYGSAAEWGYASDSLNLVTGDYDMVVTYGDWSVYEVNLQFYQSDPDDFINSRMTYKDYTKHSSQNGALTLLPMDTVEDHDFDIGIGSATVNFTVEGGGEFSNPRVEGYCNREDLYRRTDVTAFGPSGTHTEESVTVVGTEGTYQCTARAYVNGSWTTFGQIGVLIIEGVDMTMDIGAPDLAMVSPDPFQCMPGNILTVSGTATDTDGVASVMVNGNTVPFTATGNPEDVNEIEFAYDLILSPGINRVETTVADTIGNALTDKREVFLDGGDPTLEWTPEDAVIVSDPRIMVQGTASDDVKISEILVNGEAVGFSSTNSTTDPNQVGFSIEVDLEPGANDIQVSVRDACGHETSQSRSITMVPDCEAVDDLVASAKSRKVQLAWTHRYGDEYNIYRRTQGLGYSLVATVETDNYLDLAVTNGTTYYYVVRTVCSGVEQPDSNEVSATPSRRTR